MKHSLIRSRAPLRLGLAGGGTDVSPYSDEFGGAILNATISLSAHTSIEVTNNGKIAINALDRNERFESEQFDDLPIDGNLDLAKGVYNRLRKQFGLEHKGFRISTYVDAPAGSGLGSSSTLVVSIIGAFVEWFKLPLGEYDIAALAYEIEREDLKFAGGKQDQYAATFGGVNFVEFYGDKVIVNPLRIRSNYLNELEHNLILYYTETSRLSSDIIEQQTANVKEKKGKPIEAMHQLKQQAIKMKEAMLVGEVGKIGAILDFGWKHKKEMASGISNPLIDKIYDGALEAGASGGKISGAGGGGFMMFYAPVNKRFNVMEQLKEYGGRSMNYNFTSQGLTTWSI